MDSHPDARMPDITSPTSPTTRVSDERTPLAGQKRTAAGHVKDGSVSTPATPVEVTGTAERHSRNFSQPSGVVNISEMAAQLKLRLSTAYVKVQHGCEHKTMQEIEAIVAAKERSKSAASSRASYSSPDSVMSRGLPNDAKRRGSSLSQEDRLNAAVHDPEIEATQEHGPGASASQRTYESFWRDHNVASASSKVLQAQRTTTAPTGGLAPPVDLMRGTGHPLTGRAQDAIARSPTAQKHRNSHGQIYRRPSQTPPVIPSTPPRPLPGLQSRTPGGTKTAREQDAVETLLFMSSPVNATVHSTGQRRTPGAGDMIQRTNYGRDADGKSKARKLEYGHFSSATEPVRAHRDGTRTLGHTRSPYKHSTVSPSGRESSLDALLDAYPSTSSTSASTSSSACSSVIISPVSDASMDGPLSYPHGTTKTKKSERNKGKNGNMNGNGDGGPKQATDTKPDGREKGSPFTGVGWSAAMREVQRKGSRGWSD
ncbi:MAG: hypothetical protein M1817_003223 [Caeruleum heppii]|nr:MAG: hypothetical protein M1817_003223 [Caeruleum heppii]